MQFVLCAPLDLANLCIRLLLYVLYGVVILIT